MAEKYRYELHLHTCEASKCARSGGAEMADLYKQLGYTGIIVTDHFYCGNTCVPRELPWEEWCDRFKEGFRAAKKRGDEIGLDVFYGWEYSHAGCDWLTLGLDNDWLVEHPEVKSMDLIAYLNLVRDSGGYVIHAHPFREAGYIPYIRLTPRNVDAVEIINATKPDFENDRAREYAAAYDLTMTAGSDTHSVTQTRFAGIETERRACDIGELIQIMRDREFTVFRKDL